MIQRVRSCTAQVRVYDSVRKIIYRKGARIRSSAQDRVPHRCAYMIRRVKSPTAQVRVYDSAVSGRRRCLSSARPEMAVFRKMLMELILSSFPRMRESPMDKGIPAFAGMTASTIQNANGTFGTTTTYAFSRNLGSWQSLRNLLLPERSEGMPLPLEANTSSLLKSTG